MEKLIYNGSDTGLYCPGDFERFMKKCNAELIKGWYGVDDIFHIWFFPEQGVVVKYDNNDSDTDGESAVKLYGNSDNSIGQIEKIILDEAKKIK